MGIELKKNDKIFLYIRFVSFPQLKRLCEKFHLWKRIDSLSAVEDLQFFAYQQIKQNPSTTLRMTILSNSCKYHFSTTSKVMGCIKIYVLLSSGIKEMKNIQFLQTTKSDLSEISNLQPEGWRDITAVFNSYLDYDFCYPLKVTIGEKIIGVGVSIIFGKTGWLAHIIVDKKNRIKGIGSQIFQLLLNDMKRKSVETFLLIATKLGEPIYRKAGFKVISEYMKFKREKPFIEMPTSKQIVLYRDKYYSELMNLDKSISGENREPLISRHLDDALLYLENNKCAGFYLPNLGEGLILAAEPEAGLELMKAKFAKADTAIIPNENLLGIDFLEKTGFINTGKKGKRMILGVDIDWKPKCVFSRIGGNYG